MDDIADRKLPPLEDVLQDLAAHLPGWVLVEAEEEARYKDEIDSQKLQLRARSSTAERRLRRIHALEQRITACIELLDEALNDDDFQHHYSARNHMDGPALRGTLERAKGELLDPLTRPNREEPADG